MRKQSAGLFTGYSVRDIFAVRFLIEYPYGARGLAKSFGYWRFAYCGERLRALP